MYFSPVLYGAVVVAMFATLCQPQFTVPPKQDDCKLNASSPFAWVVLITDKHKKYTDRNAAGSATQGAMLTYKAIITSATYFKIRHMANKPPRERYTAVGQRIWDWRNNGTNARTNPCYQKKKILDIHIHPKAQESAVRRFLFDYALVILEGYFNVTPPAFPTMFFPNSAYEMILSVQYVNVKNDEECAIPIPDNVTIKASNRYRLVINNRIDFATIKFHLSCVKLLCESLENGRVSDSCVKVLQNRPNATMLCAYPAGYWTKELAWDPKEVDNPYAGTPYVCNGSTLGIVTQQKRFGFHDKANPKNKFDFFLVVTFLRVYSWLIQGVVDQSPKFTPFYIETASLKKESFEEPYKEPLPFKQPEGRQPNQPPFQYPVGKSVAPKTTRTAEPILNTFLAIIWMMF